MFKSLLAVLFLFVFSSTSVAAPNETLRQANQFWNTKILGTSDLGAWGVSDYWASPEELLRKGKGDCEDIAFAKYTKLVSAGVPATKLRLIYVKARIKGLWVSHMVLGYYTDGSEDPLVLDNLTNSIKRLSARTDLKEVFSFNQEAIWVQGKKRGSSNSLKSFNDLLVKVGY